MLKIKRDAPDGINLSIRNTISAVQVLKHKPNTQSMKVRFADDEGNTYDMWLPYDIVDTLGGMPYSVGFTCRVIP